MKTNKFVITFILFNIVGYGYAQNSNLREHKYLSTSDLLVYGYNKNELQYPENDSIDLINNATSLLNKYNIELPKTDLDFYPTLNPKDVLAEKLKPFEISLASQLRNGSGFSVQNSNYVELEAYKSNLKLPYNRTGLEYIRLRGNSEVDIASIPFNLDFFYTTEDQSIYNNNGISLRFNPNGFKNNIAHARENNIDQLKKKYQNIGNIKNDLNSYKSDLSRLKKLNDQKLNKAELDLSNQLKHIEKYERKVNDSLAKKRALKRDFNKPDFSDSLVMIEDSMLGNKLAKLKQALEHYDQLRSKNNQLAKYQNQLDSFLRITEGLENKVEASYQLAKLDVGDSLKNKTDGFKNEILNNPFVKAIEEFEIGLFSPFYSKSSLSGVMAKGINIKQSYKQSKIFYQFSSGKLQRDLNSFYENKNEGSRFNRNLMATMVGYGDEYSNAVYLIHVQIWDPSLNSPEGQMNTVSGVGFEKQMGKLRMNGEFLTSSFRYNTILNNEANSNTTDLTQNLSFITNLSYTLNRQIKLDLNLDRKEPGFRSLGSPFLRNDYQSLDGKFSYRTKSNKIITSAFYKYFTHNLSELINPKSEMKGFGLIAQTNLKDKPNFIISYTPFEQSNNHADSLLRTNNKFKNINVFGYYQRTFAQHLFLWNVNLNKSITEFSEMENRKAGTTILSVSQVYKNQRLTINAGYTYSTTQPYIDTLAFHNFNLNLTYTRRKYNAGLTSNYKRTLSGGIFWLSSVNYSVKIKNWFTINSSIGVGTIKQLYNFEDNVFYQAKISIIKPFNINIKENR